MSLFGIPDAEMKLYMAGLSKPQVMRHLSHWKTQPWPRQQPPSRQLRVFQSFLEARERAVR